MKNVLKIALGLVTSIGGYLEVGSIGTALEAGAHFRFELLWTIVVGTICLAFLTEMTGRLAAVSKHTVVAAMRTHFGYTFQVWPMAAQVVVDVFVLASEVGGASLALQLLTGVSLQIWALPVALTIWLLLWFGTFGLIENGVAALGLVTLSFVAGAWWLGPRWSDVSRGLLPSVPSTDPGQYAYLAVGILGATISPYLISFYSSGAVEDRWSSKDLMPNRVVATMGMGFGGTVSMAVVIVAALVLAPRGILAESYQQSAVVLARPFPRWGFMLFCASLAIGCIGAALELSLDLSYVLAQTFGWNWSENQRPVQEARFALVYTTALPLATIPSLAGIDPLKLTMFSMVLTVVVLPIVIGPLLVIMNDKRYLKSYTNGWITNIAVVVITAGAFVLAVMAIPAQFGGK